MIRPALEDEMLVLSHTEILLAAREYTEAYNRAKGTLILFECLKMCSLPIFISDIVSKV